MSMHPTKILDKGYVRLVDYMGNDCTIVNAARVSFNKAVESIGERDEKLIKYLADAGHTSPFRHATLQFEIYAPLMVCRQWWKHIVGSGIMEGDGDTLTAWNESSRRYVTESVEFHVPEASEWRLAAQNVKQGSGDPAPILVGSELTQKLLDQIEYGMKNYDEAIASGIATEQARLFLPSAYGLMVRWYWTCSLQAACHFIQLREDSHAQYEIQQYGHAIKHYAQGLFPLSSAALLGIKVDEEEVGVPTGPKHEVGTVIVDLGQRYIIQESESILNGHTGKDMGLILYRATRHPDEVGWEDVYPMTTYVLEKDVVLWEGK